MPVKIKDFSKLNGHLRKNYKKARERHPTENLNPTIDICGKKTLDYVCVCLSHFNRGIKNITIRAIGGSVSKGVEISRILNKKFDLTIGESQIQSHQMTFKEKEGMNYLVNTSGLKINMALETQKKNSAQTRFELPRSKFIDFPIYHLLFDWQLAQHEMLEILISDKGRDISLAKILDKNGKFICKRTVDKAKHKEFFNGLSNSLYRSGMILPRNWHKIAKKLSEFDDVILGIDTNILYNCTISEHLLPAISLIDPKDFVHTPNWILFVVPSAVMHELEEAANIRENNALKLGGRMGFRALQEIIELGQSSDIPGISIIIVGEANPILDTRVELQGLRKDFAKREMSRSRTEEGRKRAIRFTRSLKTSSGDMIIRDQFKEFLKQINFHKGTYFLTADKSNTALARTEGLHPIYFPFPFKHYEDHAEFKSNYMRTRGGEEIDISVPLGRLIYEIAVQFGTIKVKWADKEISIDCDKKGETLDNWIYRCLQIGRKDFNTLLPEDYTGVFDLNTVEKIWNNLAENFMGLEEI